MDKDLKEMLERLQTADTEEAARIQFDIGVRFGNAAMDVMHRVIPPRSKYMCIIGAWFLMHCTVEYCLDHVPDENLDDFFRLITKDATQAIRHIRNMDDQKADS